MSNTISAKTSRFLAVAAASLALVTGLAYAAAPAGGPDGGPGWHGRHDGHFMKQLTELHDKLNLNADEEKQWQAALDTMKQDRTAARANHEQMKQQFQALQQQPILDLNALHSAHQRIEQQDAQLREQTTTAWLNFYNGLNDQQKTIVSTALKQHFAKMAARHEKMSERWQHHDGAASGIGLKP
ncbi:periplasmic heavy metal sensor [Paraburkholderia sp.]|uniref:periplasmic heavy metal sensor n=1 Tax=Paraburkholderia sp. TaxID=1926495 RepID=UPI003D6E4044